MNKKRILWIGFIIFILFGAWFTYQKVTDDAYVGMTIIPENEKDIPLYEGLKPDRNYYYIKGNHSKEIYEFYLEKLSENGWIVEYSDGDDKERGNDWNDISFSWLKEGFDGELNMNIGYDKDSKETYVMFDKWDIDELDTWIDESPSKICIYKNADDENCSEITDTSKLKEITSLINHSLDSYKEEIPQREKTSVMNLEKFNIQVHYGNDEDIYFQSEKDLKMMKAKPEFFKLTNLHP